MPLHYVKIMMVSTYRSQLQKERKRPVAVLTIVLYSPLDSANKRVITNRTKEEG